MYAFAPNAQAASTGTITVSKAQMFGNATVSISISDPDIGVQELKDTYNPTVALEWTNATSTYSLNVTQNTGGTWVAYVTNSLWVRYSCQAYGQAASNVLHGGGNAAGFGIKNATGYLNATHGGSATATTVSANGWALMGAGANGIAEGGCAKAYINNNHLSNGAPNTRTYGNHSHTHMSTATTGANKYYGRSVANPGLTAMTFTRDGIIQGLNMTRGHTMTVTYKDSADSTGAAKDISTTIKYKETKASIYNTEEKQTTVTPGATLSLFVDWSDGNQDPTEKEVLHLSNTSSALVASIVTSSNATLQNLVNKTLHYFGGAAHEGHKSTSFRLNFTETGLNTGIFVCTNVAPALASSTCIEMENWRYNTTGVQSTALTHRTAIWNYTSDNVGSSGWKDGDTFKLAFTPFGNYTQGIYNATSCGGQGGSSTSTKGGCYNGTSVTLTITETTGTMTTSATAVSSSSDVTVTITDADMNHNPLVKDDITRVFVELNDSSPVTVTATESAVNSSIFDFTIRTTIGTTTSGCSYSTSADRLTCTIRPEGLKNAVFDIKYDDKYAGTVAAATVTATTTAATLTTDKTSYDESATSITLTFTDPDANDASATKEQYLFNSTRKPNPQTNDGSCNGIFVGSTCNNKQIANFSITSINGTNGYHDIRNHSALVMETGVNTGIWETVVTLATLRTNSDGGRGKTSGTLGLAAGDSLVFTVKDLFDTATVNVTVTIGGTVGALSFDRSDFPITVDHASTAKVRNQSRVNATVTLTDVDKNINVNARDNATLRMRILNGTGEIVGTVMGQALGVGAMGYMSWYNITALETGVNTGVFTLKFGINWGNANGDFPTVLNYSKPTQQYFTLDRMQDMVGGDICFEWEDGASSSNITTANSAPGSTSGNAAKKGVSKCLEIKGHDASITADITTGKLGDSFVVTATEADYNRDTEVKDTLYMLMIGTAKQTAPSETDTAKYNLTIALTETGVNTGEFTKTIKLEPGKSPFDTTLTANQYLRLRIRDNATSNSFYSGAGLARASATHAITIQSTTATLTVTPGDKTGPDNVLYVKLVDPDLMTTAASGVVLTQATSNGTSDVEKPTASNGTTASGTYWFGITIARSTGTPTDEDGTLHVNASDTIYFHYSDAANSAGVLEVVTATLTVTTESGAITTDKANYLIGDFMTVTVNDLDANTSPSTKQSITVKVVTDSWEIGTTITLQETSADSSVFDGKIEFIATTKGVPSASQITASIGDVVTIKYTDTLCDNNKKCTLSVEKKIGQALSKTEQVPAGTPEIVDTSGNAFASPSVGDIVIVQASITNDDDVAHTVTFLVQIKNSAGEIINLGWVRDIELSTDESQTPGLSWLPDTAGTYTAEVYVWTSISEAEALSPVKSVTFTIA